MASQPLNASISIFRTLRSERQGLRLESIKALTGRLRPKILQIPGAEVPFVGVEDRDNNKGLSSYDEAGRPIVVGARATTSFSTYETFSGVDFPITIGEDQFIINTPAGLTSAANSDLQQVARTAADDTGAVLAEDEVIGA